MCAQRGLRPACGSEQSDQSLSCLPKDVWILGYPQDAFRSDQTTQMQSCRKCCAPAAFIKANGAMVFRAIFLRKYRRTSITRSSLGPRKYVLDIGSSSHWGLIVTPDLKTNGYHLVWSLFDFDVCCVYSLESPRWGDSNEYTQHTFHDIIRTFPLNIHSYVFSWSIKIIS